MTVPQLKEKAKEALSQWKLAETGYSWNQLEKVGDKKKFPRLEFWCLYCNCCWAFPCYCNGNCRDSLLFAMNIHYHLILTATRRDSPTVWDMSFKPHLTAVQTDLDKI